MHKAEPESHSGDLPGVPPPVPLGKARDRHVGIAYCLYLGEFNWNSLILIRLNSFSFTYAHLINIELHGDVVEHSVEIVQHPDDFLRGAGGGEVGEACTKALKRRYLEAYL
jgi:hypothetical protein